MHHANHFYGHAHVLARYCGLDATSPPRIKGYLQHGWNIGDGHGSQIQRVVGQPSFVWSARTRRRGLATGGVDPVVTGAPWLYLLTMSQPEPAPRVGTIWYPFHGWERQEVRGDHKGLIDTIRAVEPGPVTVCLYWTDFVNRRVRGRYERAGFRVICHGYRGQHYRRTETAFLDHQLAELSRHARVASNRLSTAILYGATAGCEPAVYGDPMSLEDEDTTFGGPPRMRREWPQLHGEAVEVEAARAVAADELGANRLSRPDVLRELLGWVDAPASPEGLR